MARECIAIALSPTAHYELGKTYAIHIGAASNLQTVIRRHVNYEEAVDISVPSPHVCTPYKFTSYWILLQNNGQVSVGLGNTPGKKCIGTLDDSLYHALRSGVDAVKFVGLGNSALGRKSRDLKVRNVRVMPVPEAFNAFGGVPLTSYDPSQRDNEDMDDGEGGNGGGEVKDAELWAEYQKECEKAKKRATKFAIEYKQPAPDAFFKWSEARRLRANPEKGFITGMDIMSKEEKEKARKRKERFEEEERKNKEVMGLDVDVDGTMEGDDAGAGGDMDMDGDVDGEGDKARKREPLPLEQAWDNEELVGEMRADAPESLYVYPKNDNVDETTTGAEMNGENAPTHVPTKIHLFAIDWAAFKQIRTDDVLSFFKIYGPTYVEWLGELSCNVHFEDKYSAARALEALSRALPTDIPLSQKSVESEVKNVKVEETGQERSDVFDHEIKHEEIDSNDASNENMGNTDSNDASNEIVVKTENTGNSNAMPEEPKPLSTTNLGYMGWRFCNYPVRKMQSDRFGKRGTRSRCLFRIATSLDILDERPTTWPKPPPGFTTKRVLGPGDDFKTWSDRRKRRGGDGGGGKRRRRSKGGSYEERWERDRSDYNDDANDDDDDGYGEPETDEFGRSAIDTGLKAGRAGFSVEQMEAERGNAN
jgi:hypothetical protein